MLPSGGRRLHETLQTGLDNRLEPHLNLAIHTLARSFKTASWRSGEPPFDKKEGDHRDERLKQMQPLKGYSH